MGVQLISVHEKAMKHRFSTIAMLLWMFCVKKTMRPVEKIMFRVKKRMFGVEKKILHVAFRVEKDALCMLYIVAA